MFNRKGHLLILLQILHKSCIICAIFKSRPGPVQFANSDICTQTRSCHSGCCFDPENTKLITACSNFNCDPDATRQLLFKFKKVSLIITFVANCSSRGCWTITATVSSSDDAYVCRIGTNPATCDRSTVAQSAATAAPKTFSHSLKRRKKMGRR